MKTIFTILVGVCLLGLGSSVQAQIAKVYPEPDSADVDAWGFAHTSGATFTGVTNILSTTMPQFYVKYDESNFMSWSVGAAGVVTLFSNGDSVSYGSNAINSTGSIIGAYVYRGTTAEADSHFITKAWGDLLYQPLEATLTDIADGTIAEDLVNTANPWADNEVADDITVTAVTDTTWDMKNGYAWTGDHYFYSATSLNLPTGANPVPDYTGELFWDANDQWEVGYDADLSTGKALNPDKEHFNATIVNPDGVQGDIDAVTILPIEAEYFPHGIRLVDLGIKTDVSSTYSVNFEKWATPNDGSPVTLEAVATSSSLEAEDDGVDMPWIGPDSILKVDLPTTDIAELVVWGTYIIVPGD